MRIFPTPGNLVVRPVKEESVSRGGIHLPDNVTDQKRSNRGTIIAVGLGKPVFRESTGTFVEEPLRFKTGQVIIYTKYAGNEYEHDGEKLLIIRADDVLATAESASQ